MADTTVANIAIAALYALIAAALGFRLLRIVVVGPTSGLGALVFAWGIGLYLLSLLTTALGWIGWITPRAFLPSLLLVALFSAGGWSDLHRAGRQSIDAVWRTRGAALQWIPACFVAGILLLNLPQALAPPTAADAVAYHLAIPQQYMSQGRLFEIPWLTAYQPLGQHMHYLAGLVLGGYQLALLLAFLFAVLLLLSCAAFGASFAGPTAGLWAAAALASLPATISMMASGHVELGLSFYTVLAAWSLTRWLKTNRVRELALGGFWVGAALSIKYYALITLGALGLVVLVRALAQKPGPRGLIPAVLFAVIAVVIGAPWYLRNAVLTGNPFFPEFYALFGGSGWGHGMESAWDEWVNLEKRPRGLSFWNYVTSGWNATVREAEFGAPQLGIGPVFLAFAPSVVLRVLWSGRDPVRWALLSFALLFWTVWFWFAFQRTRHLLPVLAVLAALVAVEVVAALRSREPFRSVTTALLVSVAGLGVGISTVYNAQFLPVVIGTESAASYLRDQISGYRDVEWLNANLSSEDRVAHFNRTLNFYLSVPYEHLSPFSSLQMNWTDLETGDEVARELCRLNVSHVLIDLAALTGEAEGVSGELLLHFGRLIRELIEHRAATEVYRDERRAAAQRTLNQGTVIVRPRIFALNCDSSAILRTRGP